MTTKRLIGEGLIGEVIEVHFYDGNRGPGYHLADKVEVSDEEARRSRATSWFYKAASGGGSLLDYLGYGATLGTWFMDGTRAARRHRRRRRARGPGGRRAFDHCLPIRQRPLEIRDPVGHVHRSLDASAAAQMRLRGGGSEGTISSYDFEAHVGVQTRSQPRGAATSPSMC